MANRNGWTPNDTNQICDIEVGVQPGSKFAAEEISSSMNTTYMKRNDSKRAQRVWGDILSSMKLQSEKRQPRNLHYVQPDTLVRPSTHVAL